MFMILHYNLWLPINLRVYFVVVVVYFVPNCYGYDSLNVPIVVAILQFCQIIFFGLVLFVCPSSIIINVCGSFDDDDVVKYQWNYGAFPLSLSLSHFFFTSTLFHSCPHSYCVHSNMLHLILSVFLATNHHHHHRLICCIVWNNIRPSLSIDDAVVGHHLETERWFMVTTNLLDSFFL